MAVAATSVTSNNQDNTSVSTGDTTNFTINSGEAVLSFLMVRNASPTGVTAAWDPAGVNESLSLVTSLTINSALTILVYGKLNPTAAVGKFVRWTWTGAGAFGANALTLSGVDTGSMATSFVVATPASGNSGTASINISSAANNLTLDFVAVDSAASVLSAPTQTQQVLNNGMSTQVFAVSTAAGSASNTHQWTVSPSGQWGVIGINIVAVGQAGGGPGSGSDSSAVQLSESSANLIRVTVPEETA